MLKLANGRGVGTRRAVICLALWVCAAGHAGEVEVLHYWTSGGEAKSLAELKAMMTSRGHSWKDFTVTGGGGKNAMAVLKQRVLGGTAPAAALIKGPSIQEWADLNVLTNLDAMAAFEKWDDLLPKVIADQMKHRGHYVAVPVNVHRVNWLRANSAVLNKAGVTALPTTFDAFLRRPTRSRPQAILLSPMAARTGRISPFSSPWFWA